MWWVRCALAQIAHKLQLTPHNNGLYGTMIYNFLKFHSLCFLAKAKKVVLDFVACVSIYLLLVPFLGLKLLCVFFPLFDFFIEQLASLYDLYIFACNIRMFGWSILHILKVQKRSYGDTYLHHILHFFCKEQRWNNILDISRAQRIDG